MVADTRVAGDGEIRADDGARSLRDEACAQMRGVLALYEEAPLGVTLDGFAHLSGMIDAAKARRLAAERAAEQGRSDGRRSPRTGRSSRKKQSRRTTQRDEDRAEAVGANPTLGDMVESGDLSGEQLDTLAKAMKTDAAAATDQTLIDAVAAASVEQGRKLGREWAQRRTDKKKLVDEHERQRARREARKWIDAEGLGVILVKGDQASIAEAWQRILAREQQLWRHDGGRDRKPCEHPRTRDQRLFDAAMGFLNGPEGSSSAELEVDRHRDKVRARTSRRVTPTAANAKPAVVVNVFAGEARPPELVGHGPIPDSVAAEILGRANLFVRIHDLEQRTLWFGRGRRSPSYDQLVALIARDGGCFACDAPWQHCEVHHATPWNAPARGETNIDDLVLTCSRDHHRIHRDQLTVIRGPDGTWTTRPARPEELAPRGPHRQQGRRHKPPPA